MSKRRKHLYEFGRFTLDASNRLLLRAGEPVPLHPKAFDTLLLLVEHRGEVFGKEDLIGRLWPDSFVEESNLSQNIYVLRRALGPGEDGREYIKTVPKRGYQFVADVREEMDAEAEENFRAGTSEKEEETTAAADGSWTEPATKDKTPAVEPLTRAGVRKPPLLVLAAAALVVGLIVGAYFWFTNGTMPPGTPAIRSIAVLPFRPLAAEGRDESLELGMADTLIFRLSAVRGLVVRPVSAVRKYADLSQDPLAAGREQQVDAVLDSTIQAAGGKVRVTARLIRVADGAVLWADRSEQQLADLFAVQDAIAEKLAASLAPRLTEEERGRLTRRYTDDAEAYQLYLRGRYFSEKRTRDGLTKGIEYFRQAIEKDPDYALAYAGLADSYMLLRRWAFAPAKETLPQARAAAEKALRLDDTLAEAHTALGRVKEHSLDWPGAGAEYRRAIELNPNSETGHHLYAMHLAAMGRLDEATAEIRRAQELDPLSLIINMEVGRIFYFMRQYDQAIAQYKKTLELDPNFELARSNLGVAYEQKGMYEEAIAEYQKMPSRGLAPIGRVYALSGKRREAQKVLVELKEQSKKTYVSPVSMAVIHAGLGENEQAIAWLERAFDEGDADRLYFLAVHPTWDGLRSEPRFQDLLRRMGLPQ
jgi:DNA-binding winged helix-turn-helix (wHTH) protein/TolB-like protein/Flp pilus assembly protein TadD